MTERVLICGSRNFSDKWAISVIVSQLPSDAVIIQGGAPGADSIAAEVAIEYGLVLETYKADWKRYEKRAGYIRNQQMLDEGKPTVLFAFVTKGISLKESKGTAMMVRIAKKAGIPIFVHENGVTYAA